MDELECRVFALMLLFLNWVRFNTGSGIFKKCRPRSDWSSCWIGIQIFRLENFPLLYFYDFFYLARNWSVCASRKIFLLSKPTCVVLDVTRAFWIWFRATILAIYFPCVLYNIWFLFVPQNCRWSIGLTTIFFPPLYLPQDVPFWKVPFAGSLE